MADVIRVSNVSRMFSQSAERIDSLKEYVIRAARRELHFRRFWALRNSSRHIGADRHAPRARK